MTYMGKQSKKEWIYVYVGLSKWLSGKESVCNAVGVDSIPGSGISPGGGNGNPLWYSCLENPMDRGACWTTVGRVAKSRILLSH